MSGLDEPKASASPKQVAAMMSNLLPLAFCFLTSRYTFRFINSTHHYHIFHLRRYLIVLIDLPSSTFADPHLPPLLESLLAPGVNLLQVLQNMLNTFS